MCIGMRVHVGVCVNVGVCAHVLVCVHARACVCVCPMYAVLIYINLMVVYVSMTLLRLVVVLVDV